MARARRKRYNSHELVNEPCEEHEANQSLIEQEHHYTGMARTRKRRYISHELVDEPCEEHEEIQSLIKQEHHCTDDENTGAAVAKKTSGPTYVMKVWGRPSSFG
ncbi:hypothetical protein ACH5RR_029349 [Cinchona calisaya]|uniref:Uncharacterized protein n=1 Tax=Cinchona calisaya TaxID=153742 RepID=A0ABD2YSL0_9GENT